MRKRERERMMRERERNQEPRWNGGMKSIDAPRAARVCVCLLYALSTVCERRSVRRCKCNSRRGLVVSSPGDISPLLRTKLSLSPPFPSLSLVPSHSPSPPYLSFSFSSSFPPVLQSGQTRRIFEPWRPTLPGLRSGVVYFFFLFRSFCLFIRPSAGSRL